ncbi:MAG: hypothetical protein U0359_28405 [Byssovorax sp.]
MALRKARSSGSEGRAVVPDEIGHQALFTGVIFAHHDGDLAHRGVLGEEDLDLAELDAEAAHLDLGVGAAEIFDLAARAITARDRRCGRGARPSRRRRDRG